MHPQSIEHDTRCIPQQYVRRSITATVMSTLLVSEYTILVYDKYCACESTVYYTHLTYYDSRTEYILCVPYRVDYSVQSTVYAHM